MDTIADLAPDMELVTISTEFNREAGLKDMADETSIGALQAIAEAGRTDVKAITGGGGCQEYFKLMSDEKYADIWVASALYSPDMIVSCVENAIAVLNGEEVEHTIVLPSEIVDRDNVADHLDANSPY